MHGVDKFCDILIATTVLCAPRGIYVHEVIVACNNICYRRFKQGPCSCTIGLYSCKKKTIAYAAVMEKGHSNNFTNASLLNK